MEYIGQSGRVVLFLWKWDLFWGFALGFLLRGFPSVVLLLGFYLGISGKSVSPVSPRKRRREGYHGDSGAKRGDESPVPPCGTLCLGYSGDSEMPEAAHLPRNVRTRPNPAANGTRSNPAAHGTRPIPRTQRPAPSTAHPGHRPAISVLPSPQMIHQRYPRTLGICWWLCL